MRRKGYALVRSAATQNSPDTQASGLLNAHTWEPCIEVRPCRDPSKGLRRFSVLFAATVSRFATPSPGLAGCTKTVHPPEGRRKTRLPGDVREGDGYRISP